MDSAWIELLREILTDGVSIAPRNQLTLELPHRTVKVDMTRPVLVAPMRKLNYRFMCAEALWILSGSDRVDAIAPWNSRMAEFSDDGEKLAGAYGPRIAAQLDYVVTKLREDPDTRQATLTTWQPNPMPSKDVPCTIAIDFKLRGGKLNAHVFMRSSDVWLGLPYDVFSFSMLAHFICAYLNEKQDRLPILPGTLWLTAASSHLYDRDRQAALACLTQPTWVQAPTPVSLCLAPSALFDALVQLREAKRRDLRWWEE